MNIGEETNFETEWKISVGYGDIADKITIVNEEDSLKTAEEKEIKANTYYQKTIINKNELENIIGQEGTLKIYNNENEETPELITELNSNAEANENGNIEVEYEGKISKIKIEMSKAKEEGIIRIN